MHQAETLRIPTVYSHSFYINRKNSSPTLPDNVFLQEINLQRQKDTYKTADNKADPKFKHTSIEPPLH